MIVSRFIVAAVLVIAHPAPLAADQTLVRLYFGETSFDVPESWIALSYRATGSDRWGEMLLHVPRDALLDAGYDDQVADTVRVSMFLSVGESAKEAQVEWQATADAGLLPLASSAQAALAFKDIEFDNLYAGQSASGKSRVPALILIGMTSHRNDPVLVNAGIDQSPDASPGWSYTLIYSTVTEQQTNVSIFLLIDAARPLTWTDFDWLDFASDLLNDRIFD